MIRISGSEWLGRVVFLGESCVDGASVAAIAYARESAVAVAVCSWREGDASAVAGREADANALEPYVARCSLVDVRLQEAAWRQVTVAWLASGIPSTWA